MVNVYVWNFFTNINTKNQVNRFASSNFFCDNQQKFLFFILTSSFCSKCNVYNVIFYELNIPCSVSLSLSLNFQIFGCHLLFLLIFCYAHDTIWLHYLMKEMISVDTPTLFHLRLTLSKGNSPYNVVVAIWYWCSFSHSLTALNG